MAQHAQRYLDTLVSRQGSTLGAQVRECIMVMLPSGLCSADKVAQRLGMDRRTIHRHLAKEGETFSSVLDAVRAESVPRSVGNRTHRLAVIAELLGFSALSASSRWFPLKFGCSVTEWRSRQTIEPAYLAR